ncbi:MAG TPA: hypothetical protein VIW29_11790, partial [Polyangiaceae bacterium]
SRADADRLFAALSDGGAVGMPLADQFWGDYYGHLTDRFGVAPPRSAPRSKLERRKRRGVSLAHFSLSITCAFN